MPINIRMETTVALQQKIRGLKQWDDQRPGFAGKHGLVPGAGLLAMRQARRSSSSLGRLVGSAVGSALVARAASGRDGVVGVIGKLASRPSLLSRLRPFSSRR